MVHLASILKFSTDAPYLRVASSYPLRMLPVTQLRVCLQRLRDERPALFTVEMPAFEVQPECHSALLGFGLTRDDFLWAWDAEFCGDLRAVVPIDNDLIFVDEDRNEYAILFNIFE